MKTKILICIVIFLSIITGVIYIVLFTTSGSQKTLEFLISKYSYGNNITFKSVTGTIARGISLKNIEITNIQELPSGTIIKIQQLTVKVEKLNYKNAFLKLENTRINFSESESIIISGTLQKRKFDFNIYSNGFNVNEVLSYLPDLKRLIPIKGDVTNIDLYVKGDYLEPRVVGDLNINKFLYKGFILMQTPLHLDIVLKNIKRDVQLFGNITIREGSLKAHKSTIKEINGKINFSGVLSQPSFNISGKAKVEKTKIQLGLNGVLEKSNLTLSSEPSFSREKLMVMLATGKSWQSVESSLDTGLISSKELTKDFIDYYFFAGKTNKFTDELGIYDVSVTFEKDTKGIEAKKVVTENLDIGYGVERQITENQIITEKQTIKGEYQVTDELSVGVEREVKQTQSLDDLDPKQKAVNDDKLYLKYKKSF